jgi:hypothetical protein
MSRTPRPSLLSLSFSPFDDKTERPSTRQEAMASDPDDGGEVPPAEATSPAEAVSDPSPSEEVTASENEPAKASGGSVVPAAGAESSHPEGLSLNYEVRNLTLVFFWSVMFGWPDH